MAKYSEVFWKRYTELPEYDKVVKNIERGEEAIRQKQISIELIVQKCLGKQFYDEVEFNQQVYSKFRSRFYSGDHDKYLVYASYKWGYGNWREVRLGIKKEDSFEFDYYFKSRTEAELNKRMASLLRVIKTEIEEEKKREYNQRVENGEIQEKLNSLNGKTRLSVLEEEGGSADEVEEVDGPASADKLNGKKNKSPVQTKIATKSDSAPQKVAQQNKSPTMTKSKENKVQSSTDTDRQDASAASLSKRPPEQNIQALAKQQTLGSFFGLGLENLKPPQSTSQS